VLCGEEINEFQPLSFFHSPFAPSSSICPGAPPGLTPPALGVGAGRSFSILPAGFVCEVGIDAWVGGCRWGAPNTDLPDLQIRVIKRTHIFKVYSLRYYHLLGVLLEFTVLRTLNCLQSLLPRAIKDILSFFPFHQALIPKKFLR
jgi:hypothetical protein